MLKKNCISFRQDFSMFKFEFSGKSYSWLYLLFIVLNADKTFYKTLVNLKLLFDSWIYYMWIYKWGSKNT